MRRVTYVSWSATGHEVKVSELCRSAHVRDGFLVIVKDDPAGGRMEVGYPAATLREYRVQEEPATPAPPPPRMDAHPNDFSVLMSEVLDRWVEVAKANHVSVGHRPELVGWECWNTFHTKDVLAMVEDAARKLADRSAQGNPPGQSAPETP
jgi:hypothetical protein